MQDILKSEQHMSQSFLQWHRDKQYDPASQSIQSRMGRKLANQATFVVACRYWYELTDGFWGQFLITQIPHVQASDILPKSWQHLRVMKNFAGALEYLCGWRWHESPDVIQTDSGGRFHLRALPLLIDEQDQLYNLGEQTATQPVFHSEAAAFKYLSHLARRDLQYRGFRDNRISTFLYKQEALFLLFRKIKNCADAHEYQLLQQSWDTITRPPHKFLKWGIKQQEVLDTVAQGYSYDDEETKHKSNRFLYINGKPGSGKSAVLIECALRACKHVKVLIICPTGVLVHSFKSKLPDMEGVDKISVDTIQGVLNYKRPGADSKVAWCPPSALRQYEVILLDEGSQYEDLEWNRLFTCIKEQPHAPFLVLVADFQQIGTVSGGQSCRKFCECMATIVLDTVYRSADEEHLLFLNRIRDAQPDRATLTEYFGDCIIGLSRIASPMVCVSRRRLDSRFLGSLSPTTGPQKYVLQH